ncbi:TIGR01906 family membrane protein [Streptococcus saliviloxodontae]|uniref:Integral membrane protein (TIGR01906 family) n=1 Tax=Streptococcus saliviloxodontae TaxID=1349416 RepID=A0ABS2PP40_9STRE|nr:TIGR01906 family membrane protein [Streptococcus saliviloxodontae]MBM7637067.1 integral membrane protein (TIGR01906 family) [Streptococcus saliviloxodontae]
MSKWHFSYLFIWLLSLVILVTIGLAWLCYPLAISGFQLEKVVYLSSKTILYNFNQLMRFLVFPWVSQLKMADFPTSQSGLGHFVDVKHLFLLCQLVFVTLAYPSVICLKRLFKARLVWLYQPLFVFVAGVPLVIALLAVLLGFDTFFTLFHQILFPGNDSWLFNPYTDPVIYILPENFFLACFLLFLVLYEISMIGFYLVGRQQWRKSRQSSVK